MLAVEERKSAAKARLERSRLGGSPHPASPNYNAERAPMVEAEPPYRQAPAPVEVSAADQVPPGETREQKMIRL